MTSPPGAQPAPRPPAEAPRVYTYHHLCAQLLLTTTHELSSLARRESPPGLDNAYILPLDARPTAARGYSILLSATPDRRPVVIRREDGFEKRWLYRCARCRSVVGYTIDDREGRIGVGAGGRATAAAAEEESEEVEKVAYLLPGGWRESSQLDQDPVVDAEVGFGLPVEEDGAE
ncbi:MAG: hypothetical protein M1825_005680 [Sarcosagium campestre]|nr:MAG: hypothetical protein M1825_005680 [Sarcosagium campestre]